MTAGIISNRKNAAPPVSSPPNTSEKLNMRKRLQRIERISVDDDRIERKRHSRKWGKGKNRSNGAWEGTTGGREKLGREIAGMTDLSG
jgi:hypothetical protein